MLTGAGVWEFSDMSSGTRLTTFGDKHCSKLSLVTGKQHGSGEPLQNDLSPGWRNGRILTTPQQHISKPVGESPREKTSTWHESSQQNGGGKVQQRNR